VWFAGDSFRLLFILPPPGLAPSFLLHRNFLKGACFPNSFAKSCLLKKNASAYFSPEHYTAMGLSFPPKNGEMMEAQKSHSGRPQSGRFLTCLYWQVVKPSLLRSLSTNLLVWYRLTLNCNVEGVWNIVPLALITVSGANKRTLGRPKVDQFIHELMN